jgi:type IV secretion system protein VirB1
MTMTVAAALALAMQCAPGIDPYLIVGHAKHESGLDPTRISAPNTNGTRDYGLMQINEANFGWLGLTPKTALDPCLSMSAGATVLKASSAYNTGSTTKGITNGYVSRVVGQIRAVKERINGGKEGITTDVTPGSSAGDGQNSTGEDHDLTDEPDGVASSPKGD